MDRMGRVPSSSAITGNGATARFRVPQRYNETDMSQVVVDLVSDEDGTDDDSGVAGAGAASSSSDVMNAAATAAAAATTAETFAAQGEEEQTVGLASGTIELNELD